MEEAIRAEIIKMLDAGMSPMAISQEMGVSPQAVRNLRRTDPEAQAVAKPSAPTGNKDVAIAEAYEAGKPVARILEEFGIQRPKLYSVLSKFSVPTRKVELADARQRAMDEAIALYQQGVVIRQITADTGIHQPTLHAELAKRGIPMRRPRNNVKG